jgi:hypothetical protein
MKMSTTELYISFPSERLDALRFFMDRKQQTVEKELKDYLDKTYEKYVPQNVREYVEGRSEPEQNQVQTAGAAAGEGQTPAPRERQPRQSRRQREQAVPETPPSPEDQTEAEGPAEEETQGMTMSM